jgi:hypothetical protein
LRIVAKASSHPRITAAGAKAKGERDAAAVGGIEFRPIEQSTGVVADHLVADLWLGITLAGVAHHVAESRGQLVGGAVSLIDEHLVIYRELGFLGVERLAHRAVDRPARVLAGQQAGAGDEGCGGER